MAWTYPKYSVEISKLSINCPGARAAHSCDVIGNKLYIFGGWNGKKALNDLHILDTDEQRWYEPDITGRVPACRNNHTTAVSGSKIYVHGGHDGAQWLDDLYVFDTLSWTWMKPNISGTAPSARACHTMSRVGRKMYLFGGYDGHRCFNGIDILDLETMTWQQPYVEGSLPLARNAHTITVVGTKLILFGGHSGNKHLKDLHIFETETLTWHEPDVYGSPPKGLRGHTANLIGTKIYLFGGYDGRGRSNDLYILDSEKMTWAHPLEADGSPPGRQRHTASTVANKYLYIFGGFDGNKWLNDVFVLDVGKLEASAIAGEAVNNLIGNLKKLVNNSLFSDVTFILEGKELFAHRVILVSRCEHFRVMFTGGMLEAQQSRIEIKDWSYKAYCYLLEFLYSAGISNFTAAAAEEVLGLADAYNLTDLKNLCQTALVHSVEVENVCDMLILAHRFSAPDLKKFCMNFIQKNFQDVNSTQGFEHLEQVPNLLIEVTRLVFSKMEYI